MTTTSSNATQIHEWRALVSRLGLTSQVYSLSRYGHGSCNGKVEEAMLRELFEDKLVVFLNEEYKLEPNDHQHRHKKARPSQLFNSPYDFDKSTTFLMAGGNLTAAAQLTPNSDSYWVGKSTTPIETPNRKEFKELIRDDIQDERATGFATKVRAEPKKYRVPVKSLFFGEPNTQTVERVMSNAAKRCNCG